MSLKHGHRLPPRFLRPGHTCVACGCFQNHRARGGSDHVARLLSHQLAPDRESLTRSKPRRRAPEPERRVTTPARGPCPSAPTLGACTPRHLGSVGSSDSAARQAHSQPPCAAATASRTRHVPSQRPRHTLRPTVHVLPTACLAGHVVETGLGQA